MPKPTVHILGIAGTFMGGIAQLAKAMELSVTGADTAIYPPMSEQLKQANIAVASYDNDNFIAQNPTTVIIGNALSRGHKAVEDTLNAHQLYTSGPQWLAENILKDRWVVAVAGTHGKTTTAAMIAWILEYANLKPGFLIGGVPNNFGVSARLGESPFFVVEADEYDTAFFDKRSKFIHYRPRTCVLNNLEFDHADIFEDLAAIKKQFHHLVKTIPNNGIIILPQDDENLAQVIQQGCWTPIESHGNSKNNHWNFKLQSKDASNFKIFYQQQERGQINWQLTGQHSVNNALSAIAASQHCGVPVEIAIQALNKFKGVQRRMTLLATVNNITIYDDFAHHPTAIKTTLAGIKKQLTSSERLIAVFEPRSNTMRMGIHQHSLPNSFIDANEVFAFIDPNWNWDIETTQFKQKINIANSYQQLLRQLIANLKPNDTVVIMSNGSFGGIHQQLINALKTC